MATFWNVTDLRRWVEDKEGKQGKARQDEREEQDEENEQEEGEHGQPGDEPGDDEGDEGQPGDEGDEGQPGDEGEGEGEGEGEQDGPSGDGGHGGQPGAGESEGEGDGKGDEPGQPGDDGEGEGKGGSGRGKGGGKPLDPHDYLDLDNLKEVADVNLKVEIEKSEALAVEQKPVLIMDPVEYPILPHDAAAGTLSSSMWQQKLRTIKASALRVNLRRLMQKSDFAGREGGLQSGRLTGRGVTRLLGGKKNVFERRYEIDGESVAVSLLIDRSGSMSGQKQEAAADCALLLGETAANAGAKLEVIAFDSSCSPTRMQLGEVMERETGVHMDRAVQTQRWLYGEASAVYVCKTFAQPVGHLRRMYLTMKHMACGGTNDASAVQWAGQRLLKVDANRKILFVLADGCGDHKQVFRHAVEELEKQGVIVIGIGIGCTPSEFKARFTHAICINDPADLCSKAFGLLTSTIAKARKLAA